MTSSTLHLGLRIASRHASPLSSAVLKALPRKSCIKVNPHARLPNLVSTTIPALSLSSKLLPSWTHSSFTSFNNHGVINMVSQQMKKLQVRFRSNRSRRGLYDGKDIRSGNNVSFSNKKTKRKFRPNVFKKRLYSEILDEMIQFHLTASTLRSVDKAGGLDNYLLKTKHIGEKEGPEVKKRILEARSMLKPHASENISE